MRRRTAWLLLLALLLALFPALLLAPDAAVAASPPPEILGVRVGFGGYYRVGLWTPVEIKHRQGRRLSVIVPDGDGMPSRVTTANVSGESTMLYARFGRVHSRMTVELQGSDSSAERVFESDREVEGTGFGARYRPAIAATRAMILSIGVEPLGVQEAVRSMRERENRETVTVRLKDCRGLPDRWYGYEGVDALVLSTGHPETLADLQADGAEVAALGKWIRMGGTLVLCVGSQAETILAENAPLARLAPGKLEGMYPLRQAEKGLLEAFAESFTPIPRLSTDEQRVRCVPRLTGVQGIVEAGQVNLPLVIRTPRGFGQIVFLAADLDGPALSQWASRPSLVARLLDLPSGRAARSTEGSAVMHHGFDDMAGQLRSALDQFGGVRPVPFWVVAGLIIAYILLIGPVDYFFLRKVVGRMRWTWLSFPLIVLAVSLGAYCLAHYAKGNQVRLSQVDLVDVDVATGLVRGTSWANVFSPKSRAFDLSLRRQYCDDRGAEESRVVLGWLGLPGGFLGGMDPRTSDPLLRARPYDFSADLSSIRGAAIQVWSTKSFTARWDAHASAGLEARLVDEGQGPVGTIRSTLGVPLSKCLLAYRRTAFQLDTLEPGASLRLDTRAKRSELKTLLTERRRVADEQGDTYRDIATPYDRASVDLAYVLRAMMFYRAAGGQRYTGLSNGYQSFVDLSSLLGTDRAILIAQAPPDHHAAELLDDGRSMAQSDDRHLTVYRFVLPVESGGQRAKSGESRVESGRIGSRPSPLVLQRYVRSDEDEGSGAMGGFSALALAGSTGGFCLAFQPTCKSGQAAHGTLNVTPHTKTTCIRQPLKPSVVVLASRPAANRAPRTPRHQSLATSPTPLTTGSLP